MDAMTYEWWQIQAVKRVLEVLAEWQKVTENSIDQARNHPTVPCSAISQANHTAQKEEPPPQEDFPGEGTTSFHQN